MGYNARQHDAAFLAYSALVKLRPIEYDIRFPLVIQAYFVAWFAPHCPILELSFNPCRY